MKQELDDYEKEAEFELRYVDIDDAIKADKDPSVFGYAPTLHMNLDTSKLRALGWHPSCGLAEAYRRMIKSMQP